MAEMPTPAVGDSHDDYVEKVGTMLDRLHAKMPLTHEHRLRLWNAIGAEGNTLLEEHRWRETVHVHEVSHAPVTSIDAELLKAYRKHPDVDEQGKPVPPEQRLPESVDASGAICHDCGRALITDTVHDRILICPRLHRVRPGEFVPKHKDGAVECGRP